MDNLSFAFFGATNYSKELLLFLLEKKFIPKVIFSIPKEFNISYSDKRVKNTTTTTNYYEHSSEGKSSMKDCCIRITR